MRFRRWLALSSREYLVGDDVIPCTQHLDVPHVGRAVEGALVADGGGALVLAHVFFVSLPAAGALAEAAVRHGGCFALSSHVFGLSCV